MESTLKLPDLDKIKINDMLWGRYTNIVADVIVPYQWDILNDRVPDAGPSYCLNNFRIAAGERQGEHQGVVFIDSDLYKWLETVAYCIQNGSGKEFEGIADEVINLIERAQQGDGYLNTYYTIMKPNERWSNLVEGHELYCAGYLIEAAVAYFEATGKDKLLKIAGRFADLVCNVFGTGEGQIKGYPGHQEIELALIKLYRCTGERRYLSCAKYFIEQRGKQPNYFTEEIKRRGGWELFPEFYDYELKYAQAHLPVRRQHTAEGHAVRAMYMYCAMADLAVEYHDDELFSVCMDLWENVTKRRMYITGGIGSSGILERFTTDYHLPNDTAYCETCASVGLALFGRRMFSIKQDATYYDVIEKALFNTILAGINVDGNRYFYVNPLEVWPEACLESTSLKHVKPVRQRWFDVACCPTNVARTLASLGQYIYALKEETLFINLFISSSFRTNLGGVEAAVTLDSDLMQSGKVILTMKAEQEKPLTLAIRIPWYAEDPIFLFDNKTITPKIKDGYAYVNGIFSSEHAITIDFHIVPRWISANMQVKGNIGKMALMMGPYVYCLEEIDNGKNLSQIYVRPNVQVKKHIKTDLPGRLPMLTYSGYRLKDSNDGETELYHNVAYETESVNVNAVPYCLWCNRVSGEMIVWQKALVSEQK